MANIVNNINLTGVTYIAGEELRIRDGATLTVDTTPTVLPGNCICTTSGKLRIVNTSTTVPIRFPLLDMNRDFIFQGNGVLEVRGEMMELGTGTGAAQSFDIGVLYGGVLDDITYVEVETAAASGIYEPWPIIPIDPIFFHVGRTDGGGSQSEILGNTFEAGRVAFWHYTNRTLSFGNNVNGWSVGVGQRIRIPNILITNAYATDATLIHAIVSEGTPTGGTFTITIRNRATGAALGTTSALAFNASAATIDAAIEAITGAGTVTSSGGALPTAVSITWAAALASTPLALVVNSSVTGGTASVIYSRENNAANMTVVNINPSGALDAEKCMFSQKIRMVNDAFSRVVLKRVGLGGDTFQLNNSNGNVTIENVTFSASPYVVHSNFQISNELGAISITGLKFSSRRSSSRIILSATPGLTKFDKVTNYTYASVNRLGSNREAMTLTTVAPNIDFNGMVVIGGRIVLTNLLGNVFNNLLIADGHGSAQTANAAVSTVQTINCVGMRFINPGMAGIMAPRNYFFTTDINTLNTEVFGGNLNGGNNTLGLWNPNGKGGTVLNLTTPNMRTGPYIDQPALYTASGFVARKVIASYTTAQSGDGFDVIQDGEYNLVSCDFIGLTESNVSVENFIGGNFADLGLTPTTGHVSFVSMGRGAGLTLTGAAYTSQTGRVFLIKPGDTAEMEIPFAMKGVTAFQSLFPRLRVEVDGAISNVHFIANNGAISGGTYTLSVFDAAGTLLGTTAALAWNASSATVQTAVRALNAAINLSTVSITNINSGGTITLVGSSAFFGRVVIDGALLTGGDFPNVAFAVGRTNLSNAAERFGPLLTVEFAIRTASGAYGAWSALTDVNLAAAVAGLSGYSANAGFYFKLRFTNTRNNPFQFIQQVTLFTSINPSLYVPTDSTINLRGVEATDVTEVRLVSNNSLIYTFTGSGEKEFVIGANYKASAYFVRKDSLGNTLVNTILNPVILNIGDNGNMDLFYGPQIQLAESAVVSAVNTLLNSVSTKLDNRLPIINNNVINASLLVPADQQFS